MYENDAIAVDFKSYGNNYSLTSIILNNTIFEILTVILCYTNVP